MTEQLKFCLNIVKDLLHKKHMVKFKHFFYFIINLFFLSRHLFGHFLNLSMLKISIYLIIIQLLKNQWILALSRYKEKLNFIFIILFFSKEKT
jgi:hypothetical protein